MWRLEEVLKAVNGTVLKSGKDVFKNISTDSRTIGEGDLFLPLSGPTFDGHAFISDAYEKSHAGAFCERKRSDSCSELPGTIILVDDVLQALLDLAGYRRKKLNTHCIAITGSNGKTTTKEILVHMIQGHATIHYNRKNLNNLIGVSQSILAIEDEPDICVFELGTNAPGEIRRLAEVTMPDTSLITNINPSHLEGLGSLDGVLNEKLDLFYLTKEGGKIFVNADDPHIVQRYRDIKGRTPFTYSLTSDAFFRLNVIEDLGWDGSKISISFEENGVVAKTSLIGRHNLYNILAATSVAYNTGVSGPQLAQAIETFVSYDKRLKPLISKNGFLVIDDTYNANPSSMEWAIRTLLDLPSSGKRIAVLGDMRELGNKSREYHRSLGELINSTDIPVVALIGEEIEEAFHVIGGDRAQFFRNKNSLVDYVRAAAKEGDTVLVKGSRILKMEEIVEALV